MKTDYTNEANLIIPAAFISGDDILYDDGKTIALNLHGHLFITSECDGRFEKLIRDPSFSTVLYPSEENVNRYLLYKNREKTDKAEKIPSSHQMEEFYLSCTTWNTDEEYLKSLIDAGEEIFAVWEKDILVSLAYSTKGRRQLSSFFTRKEYRGKGYGSRLLEQTGSIYLFTDDQNLLSFYTDRGFVIKQTYHVIDRRAK